MRAQRTKHSVYLIPQAMSVTGMVRSTLIALVVALLYLLYAPNLLDIEPVEYHSQYVMYEGALSFNRDLDHSKIIAKGMVIGPECLEYKDGNIYAALGDGRIVILRNDKVVDTFLNITALTNRASRPLGFRFFKQDVYIADALQGLLKYDMKTGKLTNLLDAEQIIKGKPLKMPDDLDVDDQGVVYMSDYTTKWSIHRVFYGMVEHGNDGRVIAYDTKTGKYEVILEDLYAANGVQLTHDKKSLLITETTERRILRYHLKGPKKGVTDVFAYVPGEPDNIRLSPRGGYWVGLPFSSNITRPHALDSWASSPKVRKILARIFHMTGSGLAFVNQFLPFPLLHHWQHLLQSGLIFLDFYSNDHPTVVELDAQDTGQDVAFLPGPLLPICCLQKLYSTDVIVALGRQAQHPISMPQSMQGDTTFVDPASLPSRFRLELVN